ncbi:glutathione S-transferase [Rhizodiscina lignyota]|uniref:Glutathione S-transferase n=1 Tax=Rhizodiscina lignyota TaxID=1504668 RepID=A0A9P4I750_9PEZI|nr:glutathione S-transferase [Rhizodiscina lignyota]
MSSSIKPLILHAHGTGPNPYKVAIVLESLNLPYEVKLWQFGTDPKNGVKGTTFLAINENGRVPALEDPNTGVVSWESLAVINYILRVYDKQGKLGPGPSEQEHVDFDKWTALLVSTVGPMMGQVNWFKHYHPTKNEDAIRRYEEETLKYYGVVEGQLKKSTSGFILPKGFTAVDAHFYPWIYQHDFAGLSLDKYPALAQWFEKVKSLPAVKNAYAAVQNGQKL